MANVKYWIWLSTRKGLGPLGALRLLDQFETPEKIYFADPEHYPLVGGLPPYVLSSLQDKDMTDVDKILGDCDRLGLRIMTLQDADYPERLRNISDPPLVLYIRGRMPVFDEEVAIGVVGTRNPTQYGMTMAAKLGYELARGGAVVVSGIAKGLDAAALRGALNAGGTVVSVLGGGTDVYYPRENRYLYEDVAVAGALISEYPPGTENKGAHFPIRNRIISGLSQGVVAVECDERSGTMSTMNRAYDQDRDLFAVPGPVGAPKSKGPNYLIQHGAKLVRCGEDILMEYRSRYPTKVGDSPELVGKAQEQRMKEAAKGWVEESQAPMPEKKPPADGRELVRREEEQSRFTDDELAVLRALGDKQRSTDELVELTQIPVRRVTTALTMLQVNGAVQEGTGRRFTALVRLED